MMIKTTLAHRRGRLLFEKIQGRPEYLVTTFHGNTHYRVRCQDLDSPAVCAVTFKGRDQQIEWHDESRAAAPGFFDPVLDALGEVTSELPGDLV